MKKIKFKKLLPYILTSFVVGTLSVGATTLIYSKDVSYDNTSSGLKSTTVQGALDELYEKAKNAPNCDSDGVCTVTCPSGQEFETTNNGYKCSKNVGKTLVKKVGTVTSGDGLYKDTVTEGRYFYRGTNPNNYITFNNETWRIISIESDGTLKIIRNDQLSNTYSWDSDKNCDTTAYALPKSTKKYNKKTNSYEYISERIDYLATPGKEENQGCNDWNRPAGLNYTLNTTYYNSLPSNIKSKIQKSTFNIGTVETSSNTLENVAKQEKNSQWEGYVALYTVTELLRASTSSSCTSLSEGWSSGNCNTNNWLWPTIKNSSDYEWTLSSINANVLKITVNDISYILPSGYAGGYYTYGYVRPVLHLSSNISLSGTGSSTDPYTISG